MSQSIAEGMDDLYAVLDVETRIVVQQRTSEIKMLMRRTAQDIVDIGQKMLEVKAKLDYGGFSAWLRLEFEWSRSAAYKFMQVAERFSCVNFTQLHVAPSALYLLAAPSTPESACDDALERAAQGERITYNKAQEIVQEHQSAPEPEDHQTEFKPAEMEHRPTVIGLASVRSFQCEREVESPAAWSPAMVDRASVPVAQVDTPISETPGYDSDEWYTPAEYIEAARAVMGDIDLDPATCRAAQETIRAGAFFTKEDDGLVQAWHGRVWLNPPYSASLVQGFVDKLCAEYDAGHMTEAVVLVNNATDTAWFHSLLARFPACVLRRRVPFWRPGFSGGGARQGQVIFYLGPNTERFRVVFSRFGVVVSAWSGVSVTGEET